MNEENSPPILRNACPICGGERLRDLPAYSHAHLVRCLECGLTFARARPSDAELAAHYEHYGSAWYDSPAPRQRYRELLDSFEPFRRTNRILDIGSGAGFFLQEAQRGGWEAHGAEYGARALELTRAQGLD